jgi:DNA-binding winged helix-turn-helix (wHTH) protein/tetratricopeptide (TPR) repeat protein
MDLAKHPTGEPLLTTGELAAREDFTLGGVIVSPSTRALRGPLGSVDLEPRVMQVLVVLADAAGQVVTRETLFNRCWGGVYVGDDSLNRAVAAVRRAVAAVGGRFEIDTIPRTGYLLKVPQGDGTDAESRQPDEGRDGRLSRRGALVAGGAVAALSAAGLWLATRDRGDPRATALIAKGRQAMLASMPDSDSQATRYLREAVRLDPDNAEAWGLLSLVLRDAAEEAPVDGVSKAVMETQTAANRALALDPKEPNARTALVTVRPEFGRWADTEDGLRAILRDTPNCVPALSYLVIILQSVGRARESFDLNEKALALEPLSPVHLFRRGVKLWILGDTAAADLAIDRALQLWPRQPAVWHGRLMIFAFTGRADAGLALVNDVASRPALPPEFFDNWRVSLQALATRSPRDIAAARNMNLAAAPKNPSFAVWAMMALSALGELDAAFTVADGTLLRRGPLIGTLAAGKGQLGVNDQYWRRTMNLFTPATAAMRADPRFRALCEGMGMMAYWRKRGIWPDAMYHLDFR